jgi:hypothetical protein
MFKLIGICLISIACMAQNDSMIVQKIYRTALNNGKSYENLRSLCKDIGNRLSGSSAAKMAVEWAKIKMENCGLDSVYLEKVMVPHWERGTTERAWLRTNTGNLIPLHILALGGSVSTNGTLDAKVIQFNRLNDLKKANPSDVEGKIVFINEPMNESYISTLNAYGEAYPVRGSGASEAGKKGAIAVIIRSLGTSISDFPHTGTMHYEDSIRKIPAAAVSTKDAEIISQFINKQAINIVMELNCKWFDPVVSYNVIGELKGSKYPEKIITVGGHLDSWDTGEGAHDDGAGCMHALEALRILKVIGYTPLHTLRVVFFMNEENGNMGGKTYAEIAKKNNETHIAAIESDLGGFTPRGFSYSCNKKNEKFSQLFLQTLKPYQLHIFEKGEIGVDTRPLSDFFPDIELYSFIPDSQRYFDIHHNPNDVFENINKRELELGCAAVGSLLYFIDKNK